MAKPMANGMANPIANGMATPMATASSLPMAKIATYERTNVLTDEPQDMSRTSNVSYPAEPVDNRISESRDKVTGLLSVERRLWFRLATVAERRGTRVTDVMVEACEIFADLHLAPHDPIASLWAEGLADREIAARLGWTNMAVASRRRWLHLPARHKPRRDAA